MNDIEGLEDMVIHAFQSSAEADGLEFPGEIDESIFTILVYGDMVNIEVITHWAELDTNNDENDLAVFGTHEEALDYTKVYLDMAETMLETGLIHCYEISVSEVVQYFRIPIERLCDDDEDTWENMFTYLVDVATLYYRCLYTGWNE